mmetsp:Transcript_51231/g.166046  ORF Transcript_51231/g.166046 Transcript_51231/m.166046 type:complete len:138 (-) Transcript_51231:357-770(-)
MVGPPSVACIAAAPPTSSQAPDEQQFDNTATCGLPREASMGTFKCATPTLAIPSARCNCGGATATCRVAISCCTPEVSDRIAYCFSCSSSPSCFAGWHPFALPAHGLDLASSASLVVLASAASRARWLGRALRRIGC